MIKKYFLYELKKNKLTLLTITAILSLIYLMNIITLGGKQILGIADSGVDDIIFMLIGLCCFVPIYMFYFKTKARQVDLFYSLPLTRKKLYFVKSLIGLIIVLMPYTIAYWLGFFALLIKGAPFNFIYYLPLYFASLPLAVLLFGFCAFAFTRANHVVDGYLFIGQYSTVFFLFAILVSAVVLKTFETSDGFLFSASFIPQSALFILGNTFNDLITGKEGFSTLVAELLGVKSELTWFSYVFALVSGAAAWAGMFLLLKKEKPEDAEHISDSRLGYATLIPATLAITAVLLGLLGGTAGLRTGFFVAMFIMMGVSGLVSYIIYRRSASLKLVDIICLFSSVVGGLALGVLISL